ncbi:hypothetical protein [Pseudomonas leptonychotis]
MLAADGTNFRVNGETGEVVVDGSVANDAAGNIIDIAVLPGM